MHRQLMSDPVTHARSSASIEPAILAAAATGIVGFIEQHGGDIDSVFGNSGISPEMAGATTLKLRLADFCTLFEQASRRTRFDNFGLWFGHQFQPRDLGLWGYAAVSSPTLGSALENLVDLFGYHQEQSSMQLVQAKNGLMRLQYRIEAPDIMHRRQDAELSLGMFLNVMREALGSNWTPEEVHLEHARPADCDEHERAFGAPVYFAQPCNALLFRAELLQQRMPNCDLTLMSLMRNCLQQLGERKDGPAELIDRVRATIRSRLAEGYPSLETVSAELHLSTGAVQRGLAEKGASFKELVERTRREMALAYLGQRHLPISEISFLLGYSELSAFSRAVRRWTGTSPSALRETLVAR